LSYRITEQINTIFDKLKELNADRRTIEQTRRKMLTFVQDVANSQVDRIKGNVRAAQNYDENWVGALVDVGKLLYSAASGGATAVATEAGKTLAKSAGNLLLNQVKGTPGSTPVSSLSLQQEVGQLFGKLLGDNELSRTMGRVFGGIADGFTKLFTGESNVEKYERRRMDFIRKLQGEWNSLIERRTADLLKNTTMEGYYANTSFEGYLKTRGEQGRLTGGNLDYYNQYLAGQPTEGQALPQNIPTSGFGISRLGNADM
jgi:hypothetical protein